MNIAVVFVVIDTIPNVYLPHTFPRGRSKQKKFYTFSKRSSSYKEKLAATRGERQLVSNQRMASIRKNLLAIRVSRQTKRPKMVLQSKWILIRLLSRKTISTRAALTQVTMERISHNCHLRKSLFSIPNWCAFISSVYADRYFYVHPDENEDSKDKSWWPVFKDVTLFLCVNIAIAIFLILVIPDFNLLLFL